MNHQIVEIITAYSTLGLLIATGIYVCFTYLLLKATDGPEVIVFLYYEEGVLNVQSPEPNRCKLYVCVQNVGRRTARDIRLGVEGLSALPRYNERIKELDFIQNGIQLLPPDKMVYNIIDYSDRFSNIFDEEVYQGRSSTLNVRVKYKELKRTGLTQFLLNSH